MKNKTTGLLLTPLALTLSACGGTPGPSAPPAVSVSSIEGSVQNWNQSGGTIRTRGPSASATMGTSGQFSMALPSSSAVAPYLAPSQSSVVNESGCTGGFTSKDQSAQGYSFSELSVYQNGTYMKDVVSVSAAIKENTSTRFVADGTGSMWLYMDRPNYLGGSITCTGTYEGMATTVKMGMNVNVTTGWNLIDMKMNVTATPSAASMNFNLTNSANHATTWSNSSGNMFAMSSTQKVGQVPGFHNVLSRIQPFGK